MAGDVHQPLAVYRYRLTLVDALAYERLPGEWSGRRKLAFFLPLFAIAALAGFIEDWQAVWRWIAVAGLVILWAVVGSAIYNWRIYRRAKAMAAREGRTEVEEWGDHLSIRSPSGMRHVSYEMIGKAITTDSHVFIIYHGGQVIMPLRAFEHISEMRGFGAAVDQRSADAVP